MSVTSPNYSHLPIGKYNGLTIIFSNPSRFDIEAGKLLTGFAGIFFTNTACKGVLLGNANVMILEDFKGELLVETKVVLLLGQRALDEVTKVKSQLIDTDIKLDQQRGSPIVAPNNVVYIASYQPQDAMDIKSSYEKDHNTYLQGSNDSEESEDKEGASEIETKSTKGVTARANYKFWLEKDCQKAIGILSGRLNNNATSNPPIFNIYPPSEEVIQELLTHKNEDFYFDIETDSDRHITCFGFSFGLHGAIFVVPCFRYDYSSSYTDTPSIFIALAIALRDNTCVGHNISGFDLFVLAHDYKIPPGRKNYDTMLAHHRCYPELEKSLGHCISLYTCLGYHKNEGVFEPKNITQERSLWEYNAKDVWTLKQVKAGIDKTAKELFAVKSIEQVNNSIVPYLTMTLTGLHYSEEARTSVLTTNDKRMNALLRIAEYLVGYQFLPSSNKQCVNYFHEAIGLPVVSKSKITQKPSLDEKALLKLYVKTEMPLIPLVVYFRGLQKESGSLGFIPWKTGSEPSKLKLTQAP